MWINLCVSRERSCTPRLKDELLDAFRFLMPYYEYFCSLPFDGEAAQ